MAGTSLDKPGHDGGAGHDGVAGMTGVAGMAELAGRDGVASYRTRPLVSVCGRGRRMLSYMIIR